MSLDVYLIENIEDKLKDWETRKQQSIDEAGSMIGLIPIIEDYYERYKPKSDNVLFVSNITHNLNIMADKAGIYQHLWRPEEIGIKRS
jgi:signal transduction histidine kinase